MALRHRLVLAGLAMPLFAAAAPSAQAQALGRMLACQDVARAEERLACYDAAARSAIGMGATPVRSADSDLARKAAELEAREAQLAAREAALKSRQAAAKTVTGGGASAGVAIPDSAAAEREAALEAREAALKEREAKLASLPQAKASEEATLFGIPIPFTRKDTFNQQTEADGVVLERDSGGTVDAIKAPIREWSLAGDGMLIVVLENGQVWRQTDGDALRLKDAANVARISRAAFGSFMMTVNDSSKSIKVRRVDGKKPKS